ncbi:MAG TPA: M20 family metallopeptidase [Candidatus Omnitrophota bacterium]|nr:M20 family metallopeptidase [Candidatus Omnitrophota bacterium]HPD85045.1 M20 family metallopeptidase [Candidatus Omnitrophota bacterium]HRZ03903.1 M20 family metallopeptidase [Candidatus Omnitrophota bacterium]
MICKRRLVALTQKLIRINSENPPGNEIQLADFIEKEMRSLGLKVKTYSFKKNRPNVVVTLKGVSADAKRNAVLFSPHIDTVPAGGGWKFKPFGAQIHNGRIYGRGASDDKGNLAVCMEVLRSLVEDKAALKKDLVFAATADEETGSHLGIVPLLERKLLKVKEAVILDSDEFHTIIAQKGLIHCRVKIFGKKAHGAYNWQGVNAIELAAKVITRLKTHKFKYDNHLLLRAPTVNIGTIKGGDKVNMVADFCEFSVDARYLPGTNPRDVLKEIKKIVSREVKNFKIEIDDIQHPYGISAQHRLVRTYFKACVSMKQKAKLTGSEGATVISFFKKAGIPAFATGFSSRGTAHATDEYVKIENLYQGAKVLEKFIKEYDNV